MVIAVEQEPYENVLQFLSSLLLHFPLFNYHIKEEYHKRQSKECVTTFEQSSVDVPSTQLPHQGRVIIKAWKECVTFDQSSVDVPSTQLPHQGGV
ncbi:hypothetical protein HNY73_016962 [Argiope bruennichi]|uniref:Uncharacterized protein n=1 Tax=Argiope bruennichi TaxID=94029 RepID=A0A8T0EQD6_ARGBR|nr:hypothetical protein HNY73_016962 [Argiope bruennichi]